MCGGTNISKRHVITAGHCIKDYQPNQKHFVIVGHHRVAEEDAFDRWPEQIFGRNLVRVKRFIRRRDRKDIAILELVRDIEFSDRIQPACIPGKNSERYEGRDAVVTGWGGTVGYAPHENVYQVGSELLQEATLKIIPSKSKECIRGGGNRYHKLCAYSEGQDACQGDSGGPLTVKENGKFVLIGVVSSGKGCGAKGYAGVYTRVSFFSKWIEDNVGDVCTSKPAAKQTYSKTATRQTDSELVNCGNHKAPNCGMCTAGKNRLWCNGDCMWSDKHEEWTTDIFNQRYRQYKCIPRKPSQLNPSSPR